MDRVECFIIMPFGVKHFPDGSGRTYNFDNDPRGLSYLGWFQAMTLADLGAAEEAQRKALKTFAEDARLKTDPEYSEIGRRQYVQLRRFLEQYTPYLRNPSITGRISQILQTADHAI